MPLTTDVLFALVMAGAPVVTVRVKLCVELGGLPFAAVMLKVYLPAGIVPAIERSPLVALMFTPAGAPASM